MTSTDTATADPRAQSTPATSTPAPRRIVVGVDGSPTSRLALRWAADLAAFEGATIQAVSVCGVPPTVGWGYAIPFSYREETEKALSDTVDEVFDGARPEGLQTIVAEGDAAHFLLDLARNAFMVVVGSRGHGGMMGLLLGSVSAKVAELAPCPVLVVHPNGAATEASS